MPSDAAEPSGNVRSVARALTLLGLFDETHRTLSVRELIDGTGLPKSTVVRLVTTLEQRGLLWTGRDSRISPGAGLLRWAQLARDTWQLPAEAIAHLRDLSLQANGESARIYLRHGTTRVCIGQQEGTQPLRHVVRLGEQLPIWAGASGHVLLTDYSEQEFDRVLAAADGSDELERSLRASVGVARARGWSSSHGEREPGVAGVAAPIRNEQGEVVAAVALGGPTSRFTEEYIAQLVPFLQEAATYLSTLPIGGVGR